jgi:hypothetical protein
MKMKTTIKKVILILILISGFTMKAQNTYVSFEVGRDISGSGLGGNVCPAISLTHKKSTFAAGLNFQRRKMNLSGYQLSYRYALATSANEKFEFFLTGNFTYHISAYLGKGNAQIEESCHKEQPDIYENMKLKVVESHAGFGLMYDPVKCMSLGFSVGLGMFNTLDKQYDREMYREKSAVSLRLKIMARYNFGR